MDKNLKQAANELHAKLMDMAHDDRLTQAEMIAVLAEVEKMVARAK